MSNENKIKNDLENRFNSEEFEDRYNKFFEDGTKYPFKVVHPLGNNPFYYVMDKTAFNGNICVSSGIDADIIATRISECLNSMKDIQHPEEFMEIYQEILKSFKDRLKAKQEKLSTIEKERGKLAIDYFELNMKKEELRRKLLRLDEENFELLDKLKTHEKKYVNIPNWVLYLCNVFFA